MDPQENRQRKRGAVDRVNDAVGKARQIKAWIDRARMAYQAAQAAIAAIASAPAWPFIIAGVVIIVLVLVILLGGGGGGGASTGSANNDNPPIGGGPGPGGGTGDISSCSFTRSGEQTHVYKSSTLVSWIGDAANQAGIPPAVLGSMIMHESPGFAFNTTDDSAAIKNDYYCEGEGVSCTLGGSNLHIGACTAQDISIGAVTDRHKGILQISDHFFPDINSCSVTASLAWAANKLKNDGGITIPPTREQILSAVAAYGGFGSPPCNTHSGYPYDYCEEVWQDYQSCKTTGGSSPIIPVGVGGAKIASAANQIAEQLDAWSPGLPYACDETNGTYGKMVIGGITYWSHHCWSQMANYNWAGADNVNYFECTELVRTAFKIAGLEEPISKIYDEAGRWASHAVSDPDFEVFYTARDLLPGDIIEMPNHVSIVTQVGGNAVKVAQSATVADPTATFAIDGNGLLDVPGSGVYCGQAQGCHISFIRYIK
ncbi:MAG: hypothetical protein AAB531_04575 [Patescibacteria group bacterium]